MIWGKAAEMNFHGHRCRQGVLLAAVSMKRSKVYVEIVHQQAFHIGDFDV